LVVASGTQFSVELVQSQVRVVLYAGHVSVLSQGADQAAPAPLKLAAQSTPADEALAPGRELIANVAAPVAAVARVDPGRSQSWEGGQLVFDNEPLSLAVARVNRYTKEPLSVGDAKAGAVAVNGVFTGGDVQAFIEGVTAVAPVRMARRGDDKVFVSLR
jgi:transmembrane sensor